MPTSAGQRNMPRRASRVKYPGTLGKPIPWTRIFKLLSPNEVLSLLLDVDAYDRWLLGERKKVLAGLARYYEIPAEWSPQRRWHALAFCLARDNVPAMQVRSGRGVGRPSKSPIDNELLTPKKRGAPRKWHDETHWVLLRLVDRIKAVAAEKGQRLSDNAAIREILEPKVRRQAFSRTRKQLQIARKKFPRNSSQ